MKEAKMVESCYFTPRYAGKTSEKFWREVKRQVKDRTLYDFACSLQDIESRVLAVLNSGIRAHVRKVVIAQRPKTKRRKSEDIP